MKKKALNKIVIIGNGFDLAHGLETKYSDFILWYLNKAFEALKTKTNYDDVLISISSHHLLNNLKFVSIQDFRSFLNGIRRNFNDIEFNFKSPFFERLLDIFRDLRWVDIESTYYSEILTLYKPLEKANIDRHETIEENLRLLNSSFDFIRSKLIEYLSTIAIDEVQTIEDIRNHFSRELNGNTHDSILFLIFNYTSTIEKYVIDYKENLNYIHGELNNPKNPIIFGYGDEMDIFYERIERLNNNDFLRNMKSFGYFKTNNYQNLSNFLFGGQYEVLIMGHSCGISDRILLNSIFENSNCARIKLLYHKLDEEVNDFAEKTFEISRHFKRNSKGLMRTLIAPFDESFPLVK